LVSGIVSISVISFSDFPKERVEHLVLMALVYAIGVWHIIDSELVKNRGFKVPPPLTIVLFLILTFFALVFTFNLKGDFYFNKMYVERVKRNHLAVIENCDKSISAFYTTDPTSIPIHWYKGNAFASMGNYDASLFNFKKALKYTPYNPYVLNDLGSAFYTTDEADSAIVYFKKATSINPRFDDPILNLMALYINEEKFAEALLLNESIHHESERRRVYLEIIKEELNNRE